jgi:hypothetical protein
VEERRLEEEELRGAAFEGLEAVALLERSPVAYDSEYTIPMS